MKPTTDNDEAIPSETATRILFVDDNVQDYRLMALMLDSQADNEYQSSWARNFEEADEKLNQEDFDVVAVDYNLGLDYGSDVIERLHAVHPSNTYLLITGNDDPEIYRSGIIAGADSFVPKGKDCGLIIDRTAQFAIKNKRLQTSLEVANASKDWLMSVLADDFSNPLRTLQILLANAAQSSEEVPRETLLATIRTAANSVSAALNAATQTLDWGRSVNASLTMAYDFVSLSQALDEVIRFNAPAAAEKDILVRCRGKLSREARISLPSFSMAMRILLAEAIRSSVEGEDVVIESSLEESGVMLCVHAITSAVTRERVNEESLAPQSTSGKGSLGMCHRLVDSFGAHLFVEEHQNRKSFSFTLPVQEQTSERDALRTKRDSFPVGKNSGPASSSCPSNKALSGMDSIRSLQ